MSTKNMPVTIGVQGVGGFPEYGVYQFVYHGHFLGPSELAPGAFFAFSVLFRGRQGSHTPLTRWAPRVCGFSADDFPGLAKILKEEKT